MGQAFIEEETFEKKDFSETRLEKGHYEICVFSNCNFSNSNLSEVQFIECEFYDCNFSMANLNQTVFNDVIFKDCKMLGLHFEKSSNFGFSIQVENSQLNHASFYGKKMAKSIFRKCKLQEVDFTNSDISGAVFDECDLRNATFDRSNLQKTDFRNSYDYTIDPEDNQIKGAKFSLQSVAGLLKKYQIKIEDT
ncbi:pentapeptide repeat-containing protein [Flavicella sediminum]|uniref:pentapeptide repeat-containing protein n=1 Tax=Flavicella sediminum TaxID=2585141 RepID=UPI00111EC76A|nr:pentapeptide repeat-containing protein [Flavicella sediminum]